MVYFKKQCVNVKFCIQFGKTAPQMHEMLKRAFGDNATYQALTITGFYLIKRGKNAVVD
jgi:hypothetical protein